MANKLVEIVAENACKLQGREAYRFCWRKDGEWLSTSWEEFAVQVDVAAKALAMLGLIEKDTVAMENLPPTDRRGINASARKWWKNFVPAMEIYI